MSAHRARPALTPDSMLVLDLPTTPYQKKLIMVEP